MKKTFSIYSLFFLCLISHAEKIRVKGYFIDMKNDTIHVFFQIDDNFCPIDFQKRIKYFDSNDKLIKLKGSKAKEFYFSHNGKTCRMLSFEDGSGYTDSEYFLEIIYDGKSMQLFNYYATMTSGSGMYTSSNLVNYYMYKKINKDFFQPRKLFFKKDFSKYIENCPVLFNLIVEKKYGYDDAKQIVEIYNKECE